MSEKGLAEEQTPEASAGPEGVSETTETTADEGTSVEGSLVEEPIVDDVELLRQQLEEEQQKRTEYHDNWLRSVAELRNYKKRIGQEQQQRVREANAALVSHLLPALDDFERAMAVLPDEELQSFTWIGGIALIYRRIQAVLEQHGLQEIVALGQPFDPYVHDAVLFEEVPAEKDQLVLAELQRGYKFQDRILRPTLVKVGKAIPVPVDEPAVEELPAEEEGIPEGEPASEEGQE